MAVSPREDFIVVKPRDNDNEHDLLKAEVVAVGPGLGEDALDTEVGNTVVLRQDAGETLLYNGNTYIIVRDSEVRVKL